MSKITIKSKTLKWLFGGVGFHNSEATMTPIMTERFRNEIVLKTFREISPTYSRVFAGFAEWTKAAMDRFADYYDETFRKAGTLLYLVPGRMPYVYEGFDLDDYCEKVASNLEYLINVRNCKKIRYYCVTNELSVGNRCAYLSQHLDVFKAYHEKLYVAFKRHDLDVGLMATDCSGVDQFPQISWAVKNMDEITECYCVHLYSSYLPGDLEAYNKYTEAFTPYVLEARAKEKRLALGEFGQSMPKPPQLFPMVNDMCYAVNMPQTESVYAISVCEEAMAAINCGCFCAAYWTLFDYPDPFIREDGDTEEEKARYDVVRFSGHGVDKRYNKHGLIRWSELERDYSSRATLYTMGYLARLFKKGSRVLDSAWEDKYIRASAVANDDGSVSIAIINWLEHSNDVELSIDLKRDKVYRVYEYSADNVPFNKFNDLQPYSQCIDISSGNASFTLKPKSITFITTDYLDRIPSRIENIKYADGVLTWSKCNDREHAYYRVFASDDKSFIPSYENQIASTVAEAYKPEREYRYYTVLSVDKSGNVGKSFTST